MRNFRLHYSFVAFITYLRRMGVFDVSRHPHLYCSMGVTSTWTANMCSTLFLLSMTLDRFLSIMKPHKAAAFNTTERAKFTIVFV